MDGSVRFLKETIHQWPYDNVTGMPYGVTLRASGEPRLESGVTASDHFRDEATRDVAARLANLAQLLEKSGHTPEAVAHFLMRCLFTSFADDAGLLPQGRAHRAAAEP
jgi:hypothetical protein